jgi:hypothetical protein
VFLLSSGAVDDRKQHSRYPQAVHPEAKNGAAVEPSCGIHEKGCDQEEWCHHNQDRRYTLSAVKGLTVGQGQIGDARHKEEEVTRTED